MLNILLSDFWTPEYQHQPKRNPVLVGLLNIKDGMSLINNPHLPCPVTNVIVQISDFTSLLHILSFPLNAAEHCLTYFKLKQQSLSESVTMS